MKTNSKLVWIFIFEIFEIIFKHKKFLNRTRIRVYKFSSWLKLQLCFLIGGDHSIRKKDNYLTAKKGRGTRKKLTVILKMPR